MFDFTSIKAIISDFDNTISPTPSIDPKVVEAIRKIHKTDIIFTIATGRHGCGVMEKVAQTLQLTHPVIVRGGAEIIDYSHNKLVWSTTIDSEISKDIYAFLDSNDIPYSSEWDQYFYLKGTSLPDGSPYAQGLESVDRSKIMLGNPVKFIIRGYPQNKIDSLYEQLTSKFKNVHITKAFDHHEKYVIDITSHNASKHLAVLEFLTMFNLGPHEVIGIGDNYNDYPLLTACGYKVATADAPEELKAIADEIIPTANENGIVEILQRLTSIHI